MRTRSIILAGVTLFLTNLASNANITSLSYWDDGDGGIVCPQYTWPGGDTVSIYGDQYFAPGHILFDVTTDSSGDPTLMLGNAIDNDTSFAWTSYEVDIWMSKTFTISAANVSGPAGWGVDSTVQPTGPQTAYQDGNPIPNQYIGHLYFSGTPAVAISDELDFSYDITFTGSATFTEQLIPIPEPGTLSLVLCGALLLGGWTAGKRR
jgi:hypothetical protein